MIGPLGWIDLAWPMMAAACATLGFIHLGVWLRQRHRWEHLMLAGTALPVVLLAGIELAYMHSTSVAEAIWLQRLGHVPVFVNAIAIAGFTHFHLGGARRWLLVGVVLSRSAVVIAALALPSGVNYERTVALHRVLLPGGAEVSVLEGVVSRWNGFAVASWALLIALVADATYAAWRRSPRSSRARLLRVGGAISVFLLLVPLHGLLIHLGVLRIPYLITPIFCLVLLVMAMELTADIVSASQLAASLRASTAELRQSQRDRELAVEAAELVLWTLEGQHLELHASESFREAFGLSDRPPLTLDGALEHVHADDRDGLRAAVERAIASGRPTAFEFRLQTPQGAWRWVRCRGRSDLRAPGVRPRLRGVGYDVNERRLADQRVRRIVESVPSALLVIDADGRVNFANRRAVETFGYPLDELARLPVDELVPAALRDRHAAHRARYAAAPEPRSMAIDLELVGCRKDGTEFPCEISLAPFPDHDSGLVLAMITDITERRAAELAAAHQRAEVTHLSRVAVLGELSASLAHELNQPLAAILSNAEAAQRYLARDPVDLEQLREIIDDIVADDRRAGEVIRRLRSMLRKEELPHAEIDLNEVIRSVLQIMHSDLVNRGVVVESSLASNLPAISGDPVQLQQVLLNLLVNACDAMAERARPRTLTVRTRREANEVWAEVVDRGDGIPEAEMDRIFEPFFTTKPHGTGLGLSVCRTLMQSHGGRLSARNNPEGGATVTMALPAAGHPAG